MMASQVTAATVISTPFWPEPSIPDSQSQVLLHKAKQPYEVEAARKIPILKSGELLVQVQAIGLNPIDWKSAEYGFALPAFPCINGREFVGQVVQQTSTQRPDLQVGDTVLSICTDYRDFRKSAFQEYAAVNDFSAVRLPPDYHAPRAAAVGVAFVAAAISLGICLGLTLHGPQGSHSIDLLGAAKSQPESEIPEDVRDEVLNSISPSNRPYVGDWILVYGASSVTAQMAIQLAKWAGLKVVAVVSIERHGNRLKSLGTDMIIDRYDLPKAAEEIRSKIRVPIRYAIDTVGADTAQWCQDLLASRTGVEARKSLFQNFMGHSSLDGSPLPHLICLTGSPKIRNPNVRIHKVPIKLFHVNREVGRIIGSWLSVLLEKGALQLPDTEFEDGGLEKIQPGLQRVKSGELSGKRLVVRLSGKRIDGYKTEPELSDRIDKVSQ